jgi:thioredoxin-like negative regulator of GroEL
MLLARDEPDEALALLEPLADGFQVDGLRARIRLRRDGQCAAGIAALDGRDDERAFELLLGALPGDDVRLLIVGELDRRGAADPLVRATRRRLAAALY